MNDSSKILLGLMLAVMSVLSTHASAGSSSTIIDANSTTGTYEKSTTGGCPPGFYPIPSGAACAAENLTIEPTTEAPPGGDCPRGFEHVPGVRFCVATNLTLEIPEGLILLDAVQNGDCPENFSRPVGSTICIADNLVLKNIDQEVQLVKYSPNCPAGFYQPVGVRFCVPENETTSTQLPLPPASDCPAGFSRPPGVRFCVASNILNADTELRNPLAAPVGDCPQGWHKGPNGFCMPENITTGCTDECGRYEFDLLKIENTAKSGAEVTCAADAFDLWWDMPVFDEKSAKIVGFVKTKSCAAESINYMP